MSESLSAPRPRLYKSEPVSIDGWCGVPPTTIRKVHFLWGIFVWYQIGWRPYINFSQALAKVIG